MVKFGDHINCDTRADRLKQTPVSNADSSNKASVQTEATNLSNNNNRIQEEANPNINDNLVVSPLTENELASLAHTAVMDRESGKMYVKLIEFLVLE